jgi:hypothetical protein
VSNRSLRLERGEEGSVSEVPYPYDLVRSGGDESPVSAAGRNDRDDRGVEPLRVMAVDAVAEGMVISREPLIAGAVSRVRGYVAARATRDQQRGCDVQVVVEQPG